jgi:hypothetical protein
MMSRVGSTLKSLVFWDFARGSRPYDLVVVLILAFIFLTPREFFRDQPRPKSVALLPSTDGASHYWIEPERLNATDEAGRRREAETLVRQQAGGRDRALVRLETIYDGEKEVRGFLAITQP